MARLRTIRSCSLSESEAAEVTRTVPRDAARAAGSALAGEQRDGGPGQAAGLDHLGDGLDGLVPRIAFALQDRVEEWGNLHVRLHLLMVTKEFGGFFFCEIGEVADEKFYQGIRSRLVAL